MNNAYEVGVTPDDNNDRRLPGSVNPEPMMGTGPYNFAKQTPLDTMDTAGVIGQPTFDSGGMSQEGYLRPHQNANVDTKNSDTTLMATASTENLSKKYKYPQVHQDVPALGRTSVQYNDHS